MAASGGPASVSVVVNLGSGLGDRLLATSVFWFDPEADAADCAKAFLTAWDEAREASERTLRLYGAEGLAAALAKTSAGAEHGV